MVESPLGSVALLIRVEGKGWLGGEVIEDVHGSELGPQGNTASRIPGDNRKVETIPELFWPTGGMRRQMILLESS